MGNQCSRRGENAISAKLYFKIFRGSTPPYPSSSSQLRRSRLGPPINLTLLRHCFHALTTDVTFTINCERLAFQILPRIYFSSGGVAGNVGVKKTHKIIWVFKWCCAWAANNLKSKMVEGLTGTALYSSWMVYHHGHGEASSIHTSKL